jgi:hypothetical protein
MSRNLKLIFLTAFLFLLSNTGAFAQTSKAAARITAIRAQLFYDTTGKFSADILSSKDFALWNTIIGEGSAEAPSTSTLVTIEISGGDNKGTSKLELTATGDKGKVLLKKMVGLDLLDRTKFYVPFWFYNTGCEKIKLSARLFVKNVAGVPIVKTIPFACGE